MPLPRPFPPIGPQPDPKNIIDTWVKFEIKPEQGGMYLDGRPYYNLFTKDSATNKIVQVFLPFAGQQLEETYLGILDSNLAQSVIKAQTEMTNRKQRFEQHQQFSLITPIKWWNVGYWIDPLTSEITAYYQYQMPRYTPPQLQWNNWPNDEKNKTNGMNKNTNPSEFTNPQFPNPYT